MTTPIPDPATAKDGDVLFEHHEQGGDGYPVVRIFKASRHNPPIAVQGHIGDLGKCIYVLLDRVREAEAERVKWESCYHKLNQETGDILANAIGAPRYPLLRDCPNIGGRPEDGDERVNADTDCAETADVAAKLIGELRAENERLREELDKIKARFNVVDYPNMEDRQAALDKLGEDKG